MARAKKRSDGRFCVSLVVGKDKNGKSIKKHFYSRTSISDAKRRRDEYMDTHVFGGVGVPTERISGEMTLSQWAEKWLASYKSNLTPNSRDFYRNQTSVICKHERDGIRFGDMALASFKPIHISEYINSLSGKSKSTIRARKLTLKQLFEAARANGMIERDLCVDIAETAQKTRVAGTYAGHKTLTREWINLINANYGKHRFGIYALLAIWTGMRPAELCALTWDDVDLNAAVFHVRGSLDIRHGSEAKSTKTEAGERDIPIFAPARYALLSAQQKRGFVCTSAHGEPLTVAALDWGFESFKGFLERLANNVPHPENAQGFRKDKWIKKLHEQKKEWVTFDYTLYDLRVTFCTTLYDAGVDLKTAQKYMGHKDAATTLRIYTKLSEQRQADSTEKMEAFIGATYAV